MNIFIPDILEMFDYQIMDTDDRLSTIPQSISYPLLITITCIETQTVEFLVVDFFIVAHHLP